jgi:hypothetical protein
VSCMPVCVPARGWLFDNDVNSAARVSARWEGQGYLVAAGERLGWVELDANALVVDASNAVQIRFQRFTIGFLYRSA